MFSDSTKDQIKKLTESEFSGRVHLGFGMWLRNNWGLWAGSRLSTYFDEMGVTNPEDMSGIIFHSYHRHLLGHQLKLNEQVKFYLDYWEKSKKQDSILKKEEFKEYHIGDTLRFKYDRGYISKKQEDYDDSDKCSTKGIILVKDEKSLQLKIKIIETCDTKGIIIYDSKDSFIWDENLKKWVKPKKRKITRGYLNNELWFSYRSWRSKDE